MSRVKNQKGFTLIELLVTISIIGIIGVPILGLFTASMRNNMHSKSRTSIVAVAQGVMDLYKAKNAGMIMDGRGPGDIVCLYLLYKNGQSIPNTIEGYSTSDHTDYSTFDPCEEKYSDIIDERFHQSNYDYDFVIRTVLYVRNSNLLQINATVWDVINKESSRVNLISLRSL